MKNYTMNEKSKKHCIIYITSWKKNNNILPLCNLPKGIKNQGPHGEGDLENLQALTKLLGKWGWFPCNLVRASKSPPSLGNLVKEVPQENQVPQGSCKSPSSLGNLLEKVV
jgi:hypothetical protein